MRLLCRGAVVGSGHTGDRTGVPTGHWTVKRVVCPATAAQVLRCPPAAAGAQVRVLGEEGVQVDLVARLRGTDLPYADDRGI